MRKILFFILILPLLPSCGQRPQEVENIASTNPADFAAVAAPSHVTAAAVASNARMWFEPAALENCTPPVGSKTAIKWDASASDAKKVDVKLLGLDGIETLFATGEPVGSKESGNWMLPNSVVVLRDHETGAELGRSAVASKPCSH